VNTDYDLVVIGAGPGGSMAARTAAEKGLDVLLVEKRQEIGVPVRCAEGVSREVVERFVGINEKWIAAQVKGAKVYSPDGTEIQMTEEMAGNEVGFVLERKIFDRHLAKLAAKAGADVVTKTAATGLGRKEKSVEVNLRRAGENFSVKTKIVIGADGIESRVGKWAGIDTTLELNELGSAVQYLVSGVDFDSEGSYFWYGKIAPGGYAWLFPKSDNEANIGLGVIPELANSP